MKAVRARVKQSNCSKCRDLLLSDCRRFRLPLPKDEFVLVPERWVFHKCSHFPDGFVLEFEEPVSRELGVDESARWKDKGDIEAPDWWTNYDATKDIGYPVRETGKYGSHPSHDGFDDESDP